LVSSDLMTEISGDPARLAFELHRDSGVPLHRQLETAIRDSIRTGALRRGSVLPPTRVLAADLDVSRGVVVEWLRPFRLCLVPASHMSHWCRRGRAAGRLA
jgi:hypothetical protein